MRPNRRHIWAGLYLPGVRSEGKGEIATPVDLLRVDQCTPTGLFETEDRSILEGQRPSRVHVLYFDTAVHKTEGLWSRAADRAHADWRRRDKLRALRAVVGRARHCAADTGFPY